MIDSGSKGSPEQESNIIFQQMKQATSVIPHFHVILSGQSISCIILMTQGHLQDQKVNFRFKQAKITFSTNKDRNMCNTSFTWDFI